MEFSNLNLIKESFEKWYNIHIGKGSIVISYKDEQSLKIKAYHTVTIDMAVIGIKNSLSYTNSLMTITENYNHGVTTEEEAKYDLTKRFLVELFEYCTAQR